MVVVFAVGTADQGGGDACYGLYLIVAGGDIGDDLVGGEGVVVVVVVRVVHDLHTCLMQRLDGLGIFIHPIPHQEEGGLDLVLMQDIDENLGVLVAPGGIEGDGAVFFAVLGRAVHAVNGKLAGGCGGGDGGGHMDDAENGGSGQQRTGG